MEWLRHHSPCCFHRRCHVQRIVHALSYLRCLFQKCLCNSCELHNHKRRYRNFHPYGNRIVLLCSLSCIRNHLGSVWLPLTWVLVAAILVLHRRLFHSRMSAVIPIAVREIIQLKHWTLNMMMHRNKINTYWCLAAHFVHWCFTPVWIECCIILINRFQCVIQFVCLWKCKKQNISQIPSELEW